MCVRNDRRDAARRVGSSADTYGFDLTGLVNPFDLLTHAHVSCSFTVTCRISNVISLVRQNTN